MNTKEKVLKAFNELIRIQEFHTITVARIAECAHISKATFYRHFKDKYDVMNYNFTCLLRKNIEAGDLRTMKDLFRHLLDEGSEIWKPLVPLFSTEGTNSLHEFIYEYSFMSARNIYEYGSLYGEGEKLHSLNETEVIQLKIFCHGVARFFEDWVKGVYSLCSEEAAEAMYEMLPACLKGDLFTDHDEVQE